MIRVLLVDDHAILRAGLCQMLAETHDILVAGEAGSGQEALDQVRTQPCDVVVLDLILPDRSGMDILLHMKSENPDLPVLILTMHAETRYARRLMHMGASGYLTKESAPEQLLTAIRTLAYGRRYISPELAASVLSEDDASLLAPRHASLSHREFQVMCLLASGKAPSDIAESLGVSIKTVSTHRSRALTKMHMQSTAELIHYAIQHQIVTPIPTDLPA